jgi:hypothetical protein
VYNAGDFNTTETVIIPINTFDSNDPTASVTVTNLAAGDVEIHKDGSTTQRASDSGVSVSIDFDGVTGNHIISIDLSDNTDAGFYSAGSRYLVRVEGITVDGGTLNAWVGGFSIGLGLVSSLFSDGKIYVDDNGTASTSLPYGSAPYPTNTIANGKTIADANNLHSIVVKGSHSLAAAMEFYNFLGQGYVNTDEYLNINAQSIEHSTLRNITVTGATGNGALLGDQTVYENCLLYVHTNINGVVRGGSLGGECSIVDAGYALFTDVFFGQAAPCTLNVQAPTVCNIINMRGSVTISGMDGGIVNITLTDGSFVTIDNTCTAGTITLTGIGTVTDNSSGTTVVALADTPTMLHAATDALLADIPTVAEFEARSLPAADYVVESDTIAGVTLVGTCTTNTDMRGTDSAALASVCTESRLAELDAANLPADIDNILTDTGISLPADIAALENISSSDVETACGNSLTTYDPPTRAEATSDKAEIITEVDANETKIDTIDTNVDAILVDTNELQADWTNGGRLDLLIDAIKAATDLLNTAQTEPTGVPAANENPMVKLAYMFMAFRNKMTVTSTKKTYFDDGDNAEFEKDLSDDGTTYTESEINTV